MTYELLRKQNPIPMNVRREVLKRANSHCEFCGEKKALELHHLTYDYYRDAKHWIPIFGRETPDDLRALCRDCHRGEHTGPFGEFYADPEECEAEQLYFDDVWRD